MFALTVRAPVHGKCFEVFLEVRCSEHFGPEVVMSFFFFLQVLEMAQSRSMRSETTPRFGNLNVMIACESFAETMEAESLFVSSLPFNISSFHVFSASHENGLVKTRTFSEVRFRGPATSSKNLQG